MNNSIQPFNGVIPLAGTSPFLFGQFTETITHNQEAVINYYRVLNKTNHINFKVGNVFTQQELSTSIYQDSETGRNTFGQAGLLNLVDYTFQDYYVSVLYKTKLGKFVFTPSLNYHYYDVKNRQNAEVNGFTKSLLLPNINAQYEFRRSHRLTLRYTVNAQFADVQKVAEGLLIRGYNGLFRGNADLQNSLYHDVSLRYTNFNMYNFLNIYGGMNYSRRLQDITDVIQFNNLERINTPVNINTANEALTGNLNIDKRFDNYRLALSGNWSSTITNNVISDIQNENNTFSQRYKATISTTFLKVLFVDMGYEVTLNDYQGRGEDNKFENHQPFMGLTVDFLKGFTFNADYEYNSYVNSAGNNSSFDLLDAQLRYRKEGSAWEFSIEGMNLLNTTGVRRDSFSDSLISTFEYFIQKRFWLFSVMYDL